MFEAGLGGALISDVNTGIPQGSIDMRMMSGWISWSIQSILSTPLVPNQLHRCL